MEISYDPNFPRLPSTIGKSPVSYRSIFKNQNAQDMQTAGINNAELDEVNFAAISCLVTLIILLHFSRKYFIKLSPLNKMKELLIFTLSLQNLLEKNRNSH